MALAGAALLLLTTLAGGSGAGVAEYTGTLYLDGGVSGVGSGNYQISTTAPPAQGAAPTAVAGVSGTGGPSGSFTYVYVVSSGGVLTASPPSTAVSPTNAPVTVSGVPLGADLYRQAASAGAPIKQFILIASGVATTPYIDTSTATTGTPLPQSDNRAATGATGWIDFAPGSNLATNSATMPTTGLPAPTSCKGWIVGSGGGFTLPAGTWTVQVRVRSGALANGVAVLSAGAYVVDAGGNVVSTIFGPTDGAQQIQNVPNPGIVASVSATTSSATTIDSSQHLCVQFWRHQTTAYTILSANRYISLIAYDPANSITVHPLPNATAAASLSSPANGFLTASIPTLNATYTDAEADAGTLTIRLCTDSGCSSSPQNSTPLAATNGATLGWTPTGPLADGSYWWEAQAQDALGAPSGWTAARSFVIDTTAPTTTITAKPPAQSNSASGSFSFTADESVTGYQCRIDGASYAACSSPYAYGPLGEGSHTFDVKADADLVGHPGAATSYGWMIDTIPPDTSITSSPSALSSSAAPSFGFSSTQIGSTFECKLDAGSFAVCTSPQTYSGLADGPHTFQVRAVDPASNTDPSPSSYAWTIDATPPDTTIGPSYPALLTIATGAAFDFSSSEAGSSFECKLDTGSFAPCTSPKTYSALADGPHTFQVQAIDTAMNTDPSPASYTWTIDTTPPITSIGPNVPAAHTSSSSATFDLASDEAGSTFECRLDGAAFTSCATPMNYVGVADGTHTFDARATDLAGNVDTSPASYTWAIDNVAPTAPTLTAPADASLTNTLAQLRATFNDSTAGGDTGTVDFQICSTSAPAGTACAPIVQSATSGSISSGGTASVTPAALPDGTYHWQARGQDVAGNQSGWSATQSFQLDTSVPTLPALGTPADGAWVRSGVQLSATFSKPSFAGTGRVEFRICSDALCLGVVTSGTSASVINGELATWSPLFTLGDGLYYWQARSVDSVGNQSAWSASRVLHVDTHAPGKPLNFNGQIGADGLTLRWEAPNDAIANYVVFVDGAPFKNLGSTEFEIKMGAFDSGDTRSFSVVAVDLAGNVGAMSPVLVAVPNLVGLTWPQAVGATSSRGLALRRSQSLFAAVPMIVQSQEPSAPSLAERGSAVQVTLAAAAGARLAVRVKPGRVVCAGGSVLRLRVDLSAAALVRNRLLNAHGRVVRRGLVGMLRAGTSKVRVKLPRGLRRGNYRLMLDASGEGGTAHALVRVKVGARLCRSR